MKNIQTLLIISFSILIISCSKDDEPTLTQTPVDTRLSLPAILENNTILAIPDFTPFNPLGGLLGDPGIIESKITVEKDGIIANASKISIEIDLVHSFCGHIVIELISPNGQSCGLIKRLGSTGDYSYGSSYNFISGNKLIFNSNNSIFITAVSDVIPIMLIIQSKIITRNNQNYINS